MLCFFNISLPFPFQKKENWKCVLATTNVSVLCLDFDEVSAILQAQHIRVLLSRSSGEMKLDSSSCMLKPVYFAFVKTMLEFFLQTTHFVKSRAHSPRPTSKIIAMIALRCAILMKANPVVSLYAHRLFSGRVCSCKKDPCWASRFGGNLKWYKSAVPLLILINSCVGIENGFSSWSENVNNHYNYYFYKLCPSNKLINYVFNK